MKHAAVPQLGLLFGLLWIAIGCKGGAVTSPQPASSQTGHRVGSAGAGAIFGHEFSLGSYQLQVNPKTLEHSVVPLTHSRSANLWPNNQGNIVDLELGTYLNVLPAGAELFGLHKVQFVDGNLRIFFKHSHPGHAQT